MIAIDRMIADLVEYKELLEENIITMAPTTKNEGGMPNSDILYDMPKDNLYHVWKGEKNAINYCLYHLRKMKAEKITF